MLICSFQVSSVKEDQVEVEVDTTDVVRNVRTDIIIALVVTSLIIAILTGILIVVVRIFPYKISNCKVNK